MIPRCPPREALSIGWRRASVRAAIALLFAVSIRPVLPLERAPVNAASPAVRASGWTNISDSVTSKLKCDWPGMTGGVTVDPSTGNVYMVVCGQGVWKSADQGASFVRVDSGAVGGRCETGYSLCMDPAGGRFCCFMLDGTSGLTLDGGRSWEKLAQNGRGWDYAAVDWSVRKPQTIYALQHESGGKRFLSTDGGKSWRFLDEDPAIANASPFGVGVAGPRALIRWQAGEGIQRSADLGATWVRVSDEEPVGHTMVVHHGACYWLGKKGLLVSRDSGRTWRVQGIPVDAAWGPYFGRDSEHVAVASQRGIYESTNGGRTWRFVAELPEDLKDSYQPGWFLNVAYDSARGVFYASRMGKPTYKLGPPGR